MWSKGRRCENNLYRFGHSPSFGNSYFFLLYFIDSILSMFGFLLGMNSGTYRSTSLSNHLRLQINLITTYSPMVYGMLYVSLFLLLSIRLFYY